MLDRFARSRRPLSPAASLLVGLAACGGRTSDAGPGAGTLEPECGADTSVPEASDASEIVEATVGLDSSADSGTPPSCAPGGSGMTNCGAASESCCMSLEVTGGTYYRTYDLPYDWVLVDGGPTGEGNPATVSSFRLDKYLVTVGRFRQFVNARNNGSGYAPSAGSGKHTHLNLGNGLAATGGGYEPGWVETDDPYIAPTDADLSCAPGYETWTSAAGSEENLPINCVNWWESYAFCIWDGGFLPSEAEWEYAAAGGSQQRELPWGSTPPWTICLGTGCQYAIYGCNYPNGSGLGSCSGVANIAPVGTAMLGVGRWGQLDLAGDVLEWNLDWHADYVDPCTDCAYLTAGSYRVQRGGSFYGTAVELLPTGRFYNAAGVRDSFLGFRCARAP